MLATTLLALLPQQATAEGLQPGESLMRVSPVSQPQLATEESEPFRSGRVIDAFSGMPIAGATVEAWSEEITEATHGLRRIGESTTRTSGQYSVRVREGDVVADKARVRAAGYATLSTVMGDLGDTVTLFPVEERPPRLRLIDPDGQPIVHARVTSTRTCAHDVPAFTLYPDAQGIIELPEYAYQDAMPDLRFLAPGYLGIKYFDGDSLYRRDTSVEPLEVVLPRAPHPQVRLLDADRRPIGNRAIYVLDSGDHQVVRTDSMGRVKLHGRYQSGSVAFAYLDSQSRQFAWATAWMSAADREFVLIHDDGDWDENESIGTIAVELPDEIPEDVQLSFDLVHEEGWHGSVSDRSDPEWRSEFPAGSLTMGWGGAFEQLQPGFLEIELEQGQLQSVLPKLEFAVKLAWERPEGVAEIWCAVDGLSKRLEYNDDDVWIPRGRPWRMGFTYEGQSLVFAFDASDADTSIHLASLLPQAKPSPLAAVDVVFPRGIDLDAADCWPMVAADWADEIPDPERTESGWIVRGPAGRAMLLNLEAEGRLDRWGRIWMPQDPTATGRFEVDFVRAAELDLQMPEEWSILRGPEPSEPLPPSITEFLLEDGEGNRWGLVLHLEAGESRSVVIQ